MPFCDLVLGVDAEQVRHEADALVELDQHHDAGSASGLVGWCDTIHVYTWPCPLDSCVSHSTEWHSPHIGAGG